VWARRVDRGECHNGLGLELEVHRGGEEQRKKKAEKKIWFNNSDVSTK
jgi:hypothetical protein